MKINVNKETSLNFVQHKFREEFPNLRLGTIVKGKIGNRILFLDHDEDEIVRIDKKENFVLHAEPDIKVADFEKELEAGFGIHIFVFRRSKTIWLETTKTNDWTLQQQNKTAEFNQYEWDEEGPIDYREHE